MHTVLIVEDDIDLNTGLKQALQKDRFSVETSRNGKECLEMVADVMPDIILLDLRMPQMDGLTTIEHLKNDESTRTIPILVLTNVDDMTNISKVIDAGVRDYLVKADTPIDEVVIKVKEMLNVSD